MDTILHFYPRQTAATAEKLAGVRDVAVRRGLHLQVVERIPTPALVRGLVRLWNPIGAVADCGGAMHRLDPRVFGSLPTVLLGHAPGALPRGVFSVRHDSAETGRAAARELLATGWRHFAFVPYPGRHAWSVLRGRVFAEAVRLHGATVRFMGAGRPGETTDDAASQKRLRLFLCALPRPCGVFAANDAVALETLTAARFEGIDVPQAMAVLGVDNNETLCESAVPPLSSIEPDFRRAGALAAALLLEAAAAMRGNGAAPERRELAFGDLRVVSRASTRPLATHDPRVAEALLVIRREACAGLRPARVAALFPCSRRMADIRFRRATGRSIGEEIAVQRLEQVKRLLADPLRQIKVIGDFCGFADPASLRKFFRRETGMSLSAWRRVHCFPHSRKTR